LTTILTTARHAFAMHDILHMFFVELMTGTLFVRIVHRCVKCGGPIAEAHAASDGITDHKPVPVAWNQVDKLRQPITKLGNFVKAGRGNNNTGRQLVSYV
jgi:hypothetical protein